jgi:predicted dehydrogenase
MGARWADIISAERAAKLVFVMDPDRNAADAVAKKCRTRSIPALDDASLNDVDALFVVTPHRFLYSHAKTALMAKKHVFIEKPGCRTAREMRTLVSLAKRQKRSLMVGFNYRFFDAVARAKRAVDRGTVGDLIFLRSRHGHAGRKGYEKEWRMDRATAGGGVLMDQGVHLLDLMHWFLPGNTRRIESVMSDLFWKATVEENAFVVWKNARRQTASLSVGITQWDPLFSLEVYGTKGYCRVNGLGRKYGGRETLTIGKLTKEYSVREKTIVCDPEPSNALRHELREFIRAIRTHRDPHPNGTDALRVLQSAESAYRVSR